MKHKLWILILCMSFCLFSAGAIRTAQAAEDGIQTASDTTAAGRTMTRVTSSSATVTDNVSDNNYSVYYASTVKSYLYENEDGGCTRVEYTSSGVVVEEYSSTFSLESTRTLELELSLWGGVLLRQHL